MNHFYKTAEIRDMLDLADMQATEQVIEELNKEIHAQSLWTINDRVHAVHFHEKYPGIMVRIPPKIEIEISPEAQREMMRFFMRTSIPRLLEEKQAKEDNILREVKE
ncbi:hypothetical protein AB5N96_11650 [Chryseomicrobium imtechense]